MSSPFSVACQNEGDSVDDTETEADGEREGQREGPSPDRPKRNEYTLDALHKEDSHLTARKMPRLERRYKHRRFLSQLSSNDEIKTKDGSDTSCYTLWKTRGILKNRPVLSSLIYSQKDISDSDRRESTTELSDRSPVS